MNDLPGGLNPMRGEDLHFWILDPEHNPVSVDFAGYLVWADSAPAEERFHVAYTQIDGDTYVSTVFLAQLDMGDFGLPRMLTLPFETMVFGGLHDREQHRWQTWDQALLGHAIAVEVIMGRGAEALEALQRLHDEDEEEPWGTCTECSQELEPHHRACPRCGFPRDGVT